MKVVRDVLQKQNDDKENKFEEVMKEVTRKGKYETKGLNL